MEQFTLPGAVDREHDMPKQSTEPPVGQDQRKWFVPSMLCSATKPTSIPL